MTTGVHSNEANPIIPRADEHLQVRGAAPVMPEIEAIKHTTSSKAITKKDQWMTTGFSNAAMEVEVEQCRGSGPGAEIILYEGKRKFVGEDKPLARIFEEHLALIKHSEAEARREALHCIAAHLDLTRTPETRTEIKNTLEFQLWKEVDPSLVQKLVKALASLALLSPSTAPPNPLLDPTSMPCKSCTRGTRKPEAQSVCESCARTVDLQTKDGLVSANTSPQKLRPAVAYACTPHNGLVMHSQEDKLVPGVYAHMDDQVELAKSVASLLQTYLGKKDLVGSWVKTAVRLQILHSLLKIGEKTKGVVTWEFLGFVVRRQLRSSNPRIRALTLRLLVESIQEMKPPKKENDNGKLSGIDAEKEVESCRDAKRRRIRDLNTISPGEVSTSGAGQRSTGSDLKSSDQSLGMVEKSARIVMNQEVASGGSEENSRSLLRIGEMLMSALLEYMKDPYPSVREAAARALMKLHVKGYDMTSECYKNATSLFQDCFEPVRIAAIQMVGMWVMTLRNVEDGNSSKQCNEAFLQVCTMVTDMNMRVREEAFRVLGEAIQIGESVLLQTLTKKVTGTVAKAKDIPASVSIGTPDGDFDLSKFEEGANLLDASSAGVFVHGLEDEFLEVRCVAVEALAKLSCECEKMVPGAVDLLLDMLNDDVEVVRVQAMQALSQLAMAGHMSVHDKHLHMFLSVLEDISAEMREGGRNLLASSQLPSLGTFHSIIRAVLTSLEHHPEDKEGVIYTFSCLGQAHPTYTGCIAHELLQEIRGFFNSEAGLDEPRCAAILSLFLGAGPSNPTIVSLIPAKFLSYASLISHKFPNSLPLIRMFPVGLKTVQFTWSQRDNGTSSTEMRDILTAASKKDDELDNAAFSWLNGSAKERSANGLTGADKLSQACGRTRPATEVHCIHSQRPFVFCAGSCNGALIGGEKEVLDYVTRAMETVGTAHIFLRQNAFQKARLVLRRDLKMLQGRNPSLWALVRYSALYLRSLTLVVQIQAHMSRVKTHSGDHHPLRATASFKELTQKLDVVVQQTASCFSNLTSPQRAQLLELRALIVVLDIATLHEGDALWDSPAVSAHLGGLRRVLADGFLVLQRAPETPSVTPFLKLVQTNLLEGKAGGSVVWSAHALASSFWPSSSGAAVNRAVKEAWAEVTAPGGDFEDPLGFVPGLPLGIPLDVAVHNVPAGASFWVQSRVENRPPRYRYLDPREAAGSGGCGELRWRAAVAQVDDMPPVAACAVKLCVVLESGLQEEDARAGRGPMTPVIPLCADVEVHVVWNKERVTKAPQMRR